jgi:succinate-semialdehyde dehydrogenase / glutarate-semialdehyde dehydrogenase
VVLELGGSDPFIVMASADLDAAVATAVSARMINSGQSCIAAKRFIVQESIAAEFTEKLVAKYGELKVGDPIDPAVEIGPLATRAILEELHSQVQTCVQQGGKLLIGGAPLPDTQGNFYPPTILTDIPPDADANQLEFFGPVALLYKAADLDAALKIANCTPFGLGASGWTQDDQERDRLINELEAGSVFINGMVKSDPRLPFGGIKRSGYGRELSGEGIREFVNLKTVWVK